MQASSRKGFRHSQDGVFPLWPAPAASPAAADAAKLRVFALSKGQPCLLNGVPLEVAGILFHPLRQVRVQDDVPQLSGCFWSPLLSRTAQPVFVGNHKRMQADTKVMAGLESGSSSGPGTVPSVPGKMTRSTSAASTTALPPPKPRRSAGAANLPVEPGPSTPAKQWHWPGQCLSAWR
ncbi:hypothetical protein ACVWWZ_001058 [Thermostichus sp. OS-CIW-39]